MDIKWSQQNNELLLDFIRIWCGITQRSAHENYLDSGQTSSFYRSSGCFLVLLLGNILVSLCLVFLSKLWYLFLSLTFTVIAFWKLGSLQWPKTYDKNENGNRECVTETKPDHRAENSRSPPTGLQHSDEISQPEAGWPLNNNVY